MAVNSTTFDGRPPCNSCGFCSGFGCPINARGGAAVSFLHHALLAGATLLPRSYVTRIELTADGRRATGVHYLDSSGSPHFHPGDVVILAPSAIETARLLVLSRTATGPHASGIGNRHDLVGRNLMFHFFTIGVGMFAGRPHSWRGPSTTFTIDDFVGPDTSPEARLAAGAAGLPYLKGGICEVGGGTTLLREAGIYTSFPNTWGHPLKALMRTSPFRSHLAGLSMVGEDMPQLANRVDLDPSVKDWRGVPVPRITRSAHRFELAASAYYGPKLQSVCAAAPGAVASGWVPIASLAEASGGDSSPLAGFASTAHIMGTARMGTDPTNSVVDPHGRVWDVDNLFVADGSTFVSSGGFNPTLTIMALSLRTARHLARSV
jgi:choline dehydrogenase-like flavoprotein